MITSPAPRRLTIPESPSYYPPEAWGAAPNIAAQRPEKSCGEVAVDGKQSPQEIGSPITNHSGRENREDDFPYSRREVILDLDLAELYGVETKRLNQQVQRNLNRFPADFLFQHREEEYLNLKSHFATSRSGWGGHRKLPYAFTEHGAIMAASVLNTPRAVEMSVFVVRAFVRLRQFLAAHKDLAEKVAELERKLSSHDAQIVAIIDAMPLFVPRMFRVSASNV